MVLGTSENSSREASGQTHKRGNRRSGTSRKKQASSARKAEDGNNAQPEASRPLTVPTPTAPQTIKTIQKSKGVCRLWLAGKCEWGDKCCYQHKIQITQSSVPESGTEPNNASEDLDPGEASHSIPNIAPSRARKKTQEKGKEQAVPTTTAATAASNINQIRTETIRRIREAAETARLARQQQQAFEEEQERMYARLVQEEEARREREEAARLAQEQEELFRKEREEAEHTRVLHHVLEAAEAARLARQQEEAAREERERATRLAQNQEAARRERKEAVRREREEAARREQEEAARLAREQEVARREREEAVRLAQEREIARRQREEAVRKEREEAARREKEEVARLAREQEEAARREREDVIRREREEAARLAREQEAARREREEAARREKEEAARLAREQEESARREREEAAREERERVIRLAQEQEAVRREQEEAARLAREQEELSRREREEAAREERERAVRLAQEQEVARRDREEAAHLAKERAAAARHKKQVQLARKRERAKESEKVARRQKQEVEWAKEMAITVQQVVMNSFVKFKSGLTIRHVICGLEVSQILVKNLPVNTKESEVLGLFTRQGIDKQDLVILRTENVNGHQQATLLGRAADMKAIAIDLHGTVFRGENLEFAVRERSSTSRTLGDTFHLSISWQASFLTMMAYYPHFDFGGVVRKAQDLNDRVLGGQRIRAEYGEDLGCYIGDDYISPTRRVKISRIPAETTVKDIRAFSGTQIVEPYVDPLSYTSSEVFDVLGARLRGLSNSTLRAFTLENSPQPDLASAKATFSTWKGAKSAHDDLKGRVLRYNFPPLRLLLSGPHHFVFTLDEKQYIVQKGQWTELCEGKDMEINVQTRTVDQADGRKVIVTLSGHDKKVLGALKVRIESMTAGQKLDASHWHSTFKSAKGQEFLDVVYHMTGAYVRCDRKHNCMIAFGRAEAIKAAKSRLRIEVERISAKQWTIPLQYQALDFFAREGLAKMKGFLGEDNVILDVQTCTITLHGTELEGARHYLNQLMNEFTKRNTTSIDTSGGTRALCPICHDTISQPIEISCEHVYCSSCLHHYILSTLDNRNFPLKCMGGDATVCNKPLSIPLIKKFLSPQQFEQLIEAAFTSYIDKNPETFKYCTTSGCSQVYRTTTLPQELQCPSCFSEVCTACNEGHAGMTCAERQARKDPGEQEHLFEAWVAVNMNNVKQCPSCRAWIERTEGCKDMICKCGAHLSWTNLGVFVDDTSPTHGGVRTNPEPKDQKIASRPAAAARQTAESRRLEFQRENRMEPALLMRVSTPAVPAQPLAHAVPAPAQSLVRTVPAPAQPLARTVPAPAQPLTRTVPTPAHPLQPGVPIHPAVVLGAMPDAGREETDRKRQEELRPLHRAQKDEMDRIRREAEEQRQRERMEQHNREIAQQRERENARRREIYEARRAEELRRREAEEKGWCTIM